MRTLTSFSRRSFLVMPLALAACNFRSQIIEILGFSMGTTYKVVVVDHDNRFDENELKHAISVALADVNTSMSNWDESSEISLFNSASAASALEMSPALKDVMVAATDVQLKSRGRFDTTIGPLIELWGFGANGQSEMPSDSAIETAIAASGHQNNLLLNGSTLTKTQDAGQVYLAGIGKGYGADHIGRALEALGATDFLVEIGGDLFASGRNADGQPWQIGIETPNATDSSVFDVVGVSGMGLASSGDYRNYFEVDGQRFSHLIDPITGRPVVHQTASATVLAENAMLADAWSTAMLILGETAGIEIAEAEGIAVQFITRAAGTDAGRFETSTSSAFDALTA